MARTFNYPTWSAIALDRSAAVPLHEQVFEQLRQGMLLGKLAKGSRLPPSRQLATELQVSRNTVVLAYDRLLAEGYVSGRTGAGTYVAHVLPEDRRPSRDTAGAQRAGAVTGDEPEVRISRRAQALRNWSLPNERSGSFDLSPTVPALDQLPFENFAKVSAQYWRSAPTMDLGYGGTLGLPELRRQIASYLGEAHALSCLPEQILIVSSTTQGFMLAGHVLADPGDSIIVEDPGYTTRLAALMTGGLELRHLPIDREGLDSAQFDALAPHAKLIIASPTNQFPWGSTMPLERRLALLDWARMRQAWIIEYDFNNAFHFGGPALPPLAALDRSRRVNYLGNFNRCVSPALSLAYVVTPLELVAAFARAAQVFSFQASVPTQGVVADFMQGGQLAAHMRRMGSRYRERAKLLAHCLKTLTGDAFMLSAPGVGLHLSAVSREPIDDVAVSRALLERRIDVPALSTYCMSERQVTGFVFGFGNTSGERIAPALSVFSEVLAKTTPG